MAGEIHADTGSYTIEWDDDIGAVVHTWEEYVSGEEFREGAEKLLDVIKQKNTSKVLVDSRGIRAHEPEDRQWLQENWVPRVIDAGVKHTATVYPDSTIAEMDIEKMTEGMEDIPYEPKLTNDMAEAREWLAKQ